MLHLILLLAMRDTVNGYLPEPYAAQAIRDLGHDAWLKREVAYSRLLKARSPMTYCMVRYASQTSPDLEVRHRATKLAAVYANTPNYEREQRRQAAKKEFALCYPRIEEIPFLDALWFDRKSRRYVYDGRFGDLNVRLGVYIRDAVVPDNLPLTVSPFHRYQVATRDWAVDVMADYRVKAWMFKPLFLEMHARDKIWLAGMFPTPERITAMPMEN